MAASPLRNSLRLSLDYEVLWNRLEQKLLETRNSTAEAICVEDNVEKARVLRGSWGAYGLIFNMMQQIQAEARGDAPTED